MLSKTPLEHLPTPYYRNTLKLQVGGIPELQTNPHCDFWLAGDIVLLRCRIQANDLHSAHIHLDVLKPPTNFCMLPEGVHL